jgi:hypothetical protein
VHQLAAKAAALVLPAALKMLVALAPAAASKMPAVLVLAAVSKTLVALVLAAALKTLAASHVVSPCWNCSVQLRTRKTACWLT